VQLKEFMMKASVNKSGATRRDEAKLPGHKSVTRSAASTTVKKFADKSGSPTPSTAAANSTNAPANLKTAGKVESKQARVVAILQRPKGATLKELVKVTGWQPHSVRGFLAGTVRKKLKLPLRSEVVEGIRIYRAGKKTTLNSDSSKAL
jgi:hypothetical protein